MPTASGGRLSHGAPLSPGASGDGGAPAAYHSAAPVAGAGTRSSAPVAAADGAPNAAVSPCSTTMGARASACRTVPASTGASVPSSRQRPGVTCT